MEEFLLTKKWNELEEIAQKINNLPLKESLKLSTASNFICIEIRDDKLEKVESWIGNARPILSRYGNREYKLELKNEMFDLSKIAKASVTSDLILVRKRFKTQGKWYSGEVFNRGIGASLEHQQEILIYSI